MTNLPGNPVLKAHQAVHIQVRDMMIEIPSQVKGRIRTIMRTSTISIVRGMDGRTIEGMIIIRRSTAGRMRRGMREMRSMRRGIWSLKTREERMIIVISERRGGVWTKGRRRGMRGRERREGMAGMREGGTSTGMGRIIVGMVRTTNRRENTSRVISRLGSITSRRVSISDDNSVISSMW